MEFRQLNQQQIDLLEAQGCRSDDWTGVYTADPDSLKYIRGVRFSGTVRFGAFREVFVLPGGVRKHSGIRNATLHNVTVGDDTLIENVTNYIANYDIGAHTYIENVDLMLCDALCAFCNDVQVSVLNETGGREVRIYDRLSAQTAYVLAMYRHKPALIARLNALIDAYSREHSSERGWVGDHVSIRNTPPRR